MQENLIVGVEFSTIEFDGGRGEFRAKLQDAGLGQPGRGSRRSMNYELPSEAGAISVRGSNVSLRKGHTVVWRTQP